MRCDIDARVGTLEQLAAENAEYASPLEAAKAYEYRSALKSTHERLRKVGR